MQYRQHERGERENCCGASEGMGGADGGGARVEGCGEDAVLVERAFGAISEVLSERGGGVNRNSPRWRQGCFWSHFQSAVRSGFCAGAGSNGVGCFYWGNGGVVVGRRSVWAGGAEIPVEDEFGRIDHRGHRGHGEGVGQTSGSWNGIAMAVGQLGEPSLPWGFAGRCRAAGRAEPGDCRLRPRAGVSSLLVICCAGKIQIEISFC